MQKDGAAKEKEQQQAAKALQLIEAVSPQFDVFYMYICYPSVNSSRDINILL